MKRCINIFVLDTDQAEQETIFFHVKLSSQLVLFVPFSLWAQAIQHICNDFP